MLNIFDFNSSDTLTVVVGAHDLKNKTEGSVCIGVKSYHQHPNFTEEPVMNDIMLLRVTICTNFSLKSHLIRQKIST